MIAAAKPDRNRSREFSANRESPVSAANPAVAPVVRPRLRIVFIMPGIDTPAPERTDTANGSLCSPEAAPGGGFEVGDGCRELVVESVGKAPVTQERATCLRGDDEPGGHPQPETAEDQEAVCLAAQRLRRLLDPRGERVNPSHTHRGIPRVASRSS